MSPHPLGKSSLAARPAASGFCLWSPGCYCWHTWSAALLSWVWLIWFPGLLAFLRSFSFSGGLCSLFSLPFVFPPFNVSISFCFSLSLSSCALSYLCLFPLSTPTPFVPDLKSPFSLIFSFILLPKNLLVSIRENKSQVDWKWIQFLLWEGKATLTVCPHQEIACHSHTVGRPAWCRGPCFTTHTACTSRTFSDPESTPNGDRMTSVVTLFWWHGLCPSVSRFVLTLPGRSFLESVHSHDYR